MNKEPSHRLREMLREGIAAGEGVPELRNRVKSVFTVASTNRAGTIARTEAAQAFEYANERAMIESGVVKEPRWATALDVRVRDSHRALDGVVVPLGRAWPGGIKPGQEFRCRCTAIGSVDADA